MIARHRILVSALTVAAVASGLVAARGLFTQSASEPPLDLIKFDAAFFGGSSKGVYGDLKRSWFNWNTLDKEVIVKRRERATVNDSWSEQIQELTASFFITDVRMRCNSDHEIAEMFVCGVYENGTSTIERWVFTYPPPMGGGSSSGGGGVPSVLPLAQRPLPTTRRAALYQGTTLGRIAALEADPDGRFILFITRESQDVYRIALPDGQPQLELDSAAVPALVGVRQIVVRQHATEGRQFHFLNGPRWKNDFSVPYDAVMLADPDNDGQFNSPLVLAPDHYVILGYDVGANWSPLCP